MTAQSDHIVKLLKAECSECQEPGRIFTLKVGCHCNNADCESPGEDFYMGDVPEEIIADLLHALDERGVLLPFFSRPQTEGD